MAISMLQEIVKILRRRVLAEQDSVTDAHLLHLYLQTQDEPAFTELVRRHGPMVLAVCRRVLRDHHAAEDAFQATFLVLVRKAEALRWHESIAGWLHEVACRTARKARSRPVPLPLSENTMDRSTAVANDSDLREVLDEALASLPWRYRTPLVLCCCEGKSNEEAARALGCALGTVKSRLSRGRELLRKRLLRRGVAVPVAGLSATLAGPLHAGALPPLLLRSTVEHALSFAGGTAAGSASAVLAGTVLRGFWLAKVSTVFGLLAGGALLFAAIGYGLGFFDANAPLGSVPVAKLAAGQDSAGQGPKKAGPHAERDDYTPAAPPLAQTKKPAPETAWGGAVDGVQYGVEFKDQRNRYAIDDVVAFVLRARNVTDKPASFDQVDIFNFFATANVAPGKSLLSMESQLLDYGVQPYGVVLPTVIDAKGNETLKVFAEHIPKGFFLASVRKIEIAPKETTVLGEVTFCVGPFVGPFNDGIASKARIGVVPGTYGVRFDTVCWLPGHKRPTGTLEMIVTEKKSPPTATETAWGDAVDGVQYGVEFKDQRNRYAIGDVVTFVLKARNASGKPAGFDQVAILNFYAGAIGAKGQGSQYLGRGAVLPTVIDAKGKETKGKETNASAGLIPKGLIWAEVRKIEIAPKETTVLGEVTFGVGPSDAGKACIDAVPGTYSVRFDTVCWLPGHKRPTGTLEMIVTEKPPPIAWAGAGENQKDLFFGVSFGENRTKFALGEQIQFVFHAKYRDAKKDNIKNIGLQLEQIQAQLQKLHQLGENQPGANEAKRSLEARQKTLQKTLWDETLKAQIAQDAKPIKLSQFAIHQTISGDFWPLIDDVVPVFTDAAGKTFKGVWNTNKWPNEVGVYREEVKAGEEVTVGWVGWNLDPLQIRGVDLKPGKYTVHFEKIMLKETSPTGKLDVEIVAPAPDNLPPNKTAWGKAVDGIEYGIEFKEKRDAYRIGDKMTLVLKARNVNPWTENRGPWTWYPFKISPANEFGPLPKVIDSVGKEVQVKARQMMSPLSFPDRTITTAPGQVVILGEVAFTIGTGNQSIDAQPGKHSIYYDSINLRGKAMPTGKLEMVVRKPGILELYEKLKPGMARTEVETILGKPIGPDLKQPSGEDLKQPSGEVNAYYLGSEYMERAFEKIESPYAWWGIEVTYVADKLTKKRHNLQWVKRPAWGKAVDGLQFGFEFKDHDYPYRFRVGDNVTFVFKAHNYTDKPVRFEQVEITDGVRKTEAGKQGHIVPKVLDEKNDKEVKVLGMWHSEPPIAKVRTVELAANETATLGQITCSIGPNPAMNSIDAGPGRYEVHFDTVCWLPGHQRPTGTLVMVVEKAAVEGKAGKGDDAKKPPSPLPEDLVAAWKKAGGEASWVSLGVSIFPLLFHKGEVSQVGDMPGFIFREWPLGVIGGLPQPDRGFCLSFRRTEKTDAGLKELAGLKTLEALDLQASDVTDAGLKELAGLKSLHALYLGTTLVTDAGLKNLAGLTNLETLDLGATYVTGVGLKDLAGLKSLRTLYLRYNKLTDAGLKELAELQSLQTLGIENTNLTDARLKELARLKSLQSLNLMDMQLTDAGLKELAGMKGLRSLSFYGAQVTDAGLKELAGLKGLRSLSLPQAQVTDAGLKELAGLNELESLYLSSPQVTDAGLKELAALKSLKDLQLHDTKVTGAGMKVLPRLRLLGISGPNVTDATVKELARLESLETLSLDYPGGTHVTDFGLKELAGLRYLQDLFLNSTHVTDAGLKELVGLKSLRQLILTNTKVTDAGIAELQKALPQCRIDKMKGAV